ncbi:abortive infection protein [Salmonella enterica]|uniref:abortive infection protein n=1 Tax=Salmonella enterica TaxID=28901 RepID=UPI00107D70A1|nr:abortive infection protein [Salmonella enterica]EAA3133240.1 abortive infection protein [Salmonella enterica subsp. enterica serovar Chester]EBV6641648.1 abortive infection protein [Salmonella enterica subsp. enterica serovar Pomona]ECB7912842.1 abortive infection protein [Salmonella enterica subsp. enterica serovar Minnesota]EGE9388327.1 abortive infection protein [Salmonella enterica subsp. enterica serovar Bredeney]EDH8245933.1 abortive infection protein [Salmonella enterica subsp. enter
MDFLKDTEGTVLFPFQTEIVFVLAIITTAKDLFVSAWGHTGQKQYWSASLCILLLVAYVGLCAAVVWAVVPWLKAFIVSKFAVSTLWVTPVKSGLLWSIGKVVGAAYRTFTLSK